MCAETVGFPSFGDEHALLAGEMHGLRLSDFMPDLRQTADIETFPEPGHFVRECHSSVNSADNLSKGNGFG